MTPDTASRPAEVPTRRAVLDLLKRLGPRDAGDLAAELGLSAMAVRQHLYALRDDRLVTFAEQPRPIGRPSKLWRLTAAADRYFPDAHAELTKYDSLARNVDQPIAALIKDLKSTGMLEQATQTGRRTLAWQSLSFLKPSTNS